MQQTLLALAAVLAFAVFAVTRHEDQATLERRAVGDEVERALTEAVSGRLAEIGRLPFDELDVGHERLRTVPSALPLGADAGETAVALFDDVDDFASLSAVLGGPELRTVPVGTGTMTFALDVQVRWVQPRDPAQPSAQPTLAKEVVVRGHEPASAARAGRPAASVTLRRVMTPSTQAR